MNYTLNQLEIFLKVASTGSVTRAAEELHLTQPAVSIQLRNFQEQFEIPLTETIGRKIYITGFGREIAETARNIMSELNAMHYKLMAYKGHLAGKLSVSVASTGSHVMPYFLAGFMKLHPGIELMMDVNKKKRVLESLGSNRVDFTLVSIIPGSLNVQRFDLLENQLFLVGSGHSPHVRLQGRKGTLEQLPLIFREPGSGTRLAMEQYFDQNKVKVQMKMELTSNEAVKQAVLAGLGYSVMPYVGIRKELASGEMKVIPLRGFPIRTTWSLIWLKDKRLSPVANAFLDYLRAERPAILQTYFENNT